MRESKFGIALVIESSELSGGYVLGFRLDPVEKLNSIFEELSNLYIVHASNPDFGVHAYLSHTLLDGNMQLGGSGLETITNEKLLETLTNGAKSNVANGDLNGALGSAMLSSMLYTASGSAAHLSNPEDESIIGDTDETTGRSHSYGDAVAAYLAEGEAETVETKKGNEWVYIPELGLAIEKIKAGFTMESLWEVVEK